MTDDVKETEYMRGFRAGWDEALQTQKAIQPDSELISAARDMLEALRGVVRVADRRTVEFDAARTAIAKATSSDLGRDQA